MRLHETTHGRARSSRRLVAFLALGLGAALLVGPKIPAGAGATSVAAARAASAGSEEPVPQTDASVPAIDVTMFGASPREAPNETWGFGKTDEGGALAPTLVHYVTGAGWSLGPAPLDVAGQPLSGFELDAAAGGYPSPLAGQMNADGGGALLGHLPDSELASGSRQALLVRNPGGAFQEVPPPEGEAALAETEGESLYGSDSSPMFAPLEEAGGTAGALVVPYVAAGLEIEHRVLQWNGHRWSSEAIEIPELTSGSGKEGFRVVAIGASAPANAWLLAELPSDYPNGAMVLLRRKVGEGAEPTTWQPVAVSEGTTPEQIYPLRTPLQGHAPGRFSVRSARAQALTVTDEGVWVDGERPEPEVQAATTLYVRPEGAGAAVVSSWCKLPERAAALAESGSVARCAHELPEALPSGEFRSFAWSTPGESVGHPYGERVIGGLPEGVSLRLEGETFRRMYALGGSEGISDVGNTFGAAFSGPQEGWLGQQYLPVHLTRSPEPSLLEPWPVTFSKALVAVAPQPGAPVGSPTSEALAVGDNGEVARYVPAKAAWLPESLFGPGQRVEKPRLRAVAWPIQTRAYAVGNEGQMWLWRPLQEGATEERGAEVHGLWERDPATPRNFRGNLLGIAFDPADPSRGYAVGEDGVLLRYGKTWTQETLPTELASASFTSIAFAGSEAIVAYHILPNPNENAYQGGLLVNEGSGWQVDRGAAAAVGSSVPWTVAGLPDGAAAFVAGERSGQGNGGLLFERAAAAAPWKQAPTPLPGVDEPGSLALFHENGALRAIASGSVPNPFGAESVTPSPPGSPPPFLAAYPLTNGYGKGNVIRQTATGWQDEEHELSDVLEPPGGYSYYDLTFRPDPVSAVLVNESGGEGWAVGGFIDEHDAALDTADVERYHEQGHAVAPPPVAEQVPVKVAPGNPTFAVGGGAQCAAPCANLQKARIGPDTWLQSALGGAARIPGVRAFIYTGPRLSKGETDVSPPPFPFTPELERYAELLSASPLPVLTAISPWELQPRSAVEGSERSFETELSGFPGPFGAATPPLTESATLEPQRTPTPQERAQASAQRGTQAEYYSFVSNGPGGKVRMIVLDDSGPVQRTQLEWLAGQLTAAKGASERAVVFGNGAVSGSPGPGAEQAQKLAQVLVTGSLSGCPAPAGRAGASAYFYDAPQQDVYEKLGACGESIPAFGSGSVGYLDSAAARSSGRTGAAGFLVAEVEPARAETTENNRAEVVARLVPNVGELALEAKDGLLLRRSKSPHEFVALARRPRAGNEVAAGEPENPFTDPYIPLEPCRAEGCDTERQLENPNYAFTSEDTEVGNFIKVEKTNPRVPLINAQGLAEPEAETEAHTSELFCAFNAGTTVVKVAADGYAYKATVTVEEAKPEKPCGTVHVNKPPAHTKTAAPVPPPAPAPAPVSPASSTPPPVVLLPAPAAIPASRPAPVRPLRTFYVPAAPQATLLAFVPPPLPTPARPSPPSGTSAVTSPVQAAQKEEEQEEAIESVSNNAVAYRASEHELPPEYILGLVILAAFAGASIARRRPRGGRRGVAVARATVPGVQREAWMDRTPRRR